MTDLANIDFEKIINNLPRFVFNFVHPLTNGDHVRINSAIKRFNTYLKKDLNRLIIGQISTANMKQYVADNLLMIRAVKILMNLDLYCVFTNDNDVYLELPIEELETWCHCRIGQVLPDKVLL